MKMIFKTERNPPTMSMPRLAATCLAAATLVTGVGAAHADRRAFTRTYEYTTMPEGQTEVELITTQSRTTFDGATSPQAFSLQLELEHGLTDRWDVALYHVFEQSTDGRGGGTALALSELKLETRYRFAERGELPVDLLLYGEVAKQFGAGAYDVETKVILARDLGPVTAAVNLIGEVGFGNDVDETELELGWAAGASYELSPTWKLGAETWGDFEAEHTDAIAASAGPAVSWAPSPALWVAATAGWGLTDTADAFSVRAVLGLGL